MHIQGDDVRGRLPSTSKIGRIDTFLAKTGLVADPIFNNIGLLIGRDESYSIPFLKQVFKFSGGVG